MIRPLSRGSCLILSPLQTRRSCFGESAILDGKVPPAVGQNDLDGDASGTSSGDDAEAADCGGVGFLAAVDGTGEPVPRVCATVTFDAADGGGE